MDGLNPALRRRRRSTATEQEDSRSRKRGPSARPIPQELGTMELDTTVTEGAAKAEDGPEAEDSPKQADDGEDGDYKDIELRMGQITLTRNMNEPSSNKVARCWIEAPVTVKE